MLFWIYMLVMNLLIPAVMIGFGNRFSKKAPDEINQIYGYRTSMSMKNRDTWEYAHHYFGRLWNRLGKILLPPTVIAMCLVIGKDKDTVGNMGFIVSVVQLIILILPIFFTERALRKKFDKLGRRKEL